MLTFRETPIPADIEAVRAIVSSSGFFSESEIEVAAELVEERLSKGLSSGYYFLFAEDAERMLGYACYGPIPCTAASWDLYWIAVQPDLRAGAWAGGSWNSWRRKSGRWEERGSTWTPPHANSTGLRSPFMPTAATGRRRC